MKKKKYNYLENKSYVSTKTSGDVPIINEFSTLKTSLQLISNTNKNTNAPIYFVVSMDEEGDFARSVYNRLNSHPGKDRHAVLLSFSLLKNLHKKDIWITNNVIIYLVGHGYVGRVGKWTGQDLAEQLTPTLTQYPNMKRIKLTSCYSADFVNLDTIPNRNTKESLKNNGYDTSLAQQVSHTLNTNKLGHIEVSGYRGQHHEKRSSNEAGKYAKVTHSFVELDNNVSIQAKDARFTYQYDKLIRGPQKAVLDAPLTGELSPEDCSTKNLKFSFTCHKGK